MSDIESHRFIPVVGAYGQRAPVGVTVREKRNYSFDLSKWLEQGQEVTAPTARLLLSGSSIPNVITGVSVTNGNKVVLTIDWRVQGITSGRTYRLWVTVNIDNQIKEGFADFYVGD
jgi:hypothetical protein